jgi:hypothetical protein
LRQELAANENGCRSRASPPPCRRLPQGARALDAFKPDLVLIWGDDQCENFREDGVPSFCVFALDAIDSRPFGRPGRTEHGNVWGESPDTVVRVAGHPRRCHLAAELIRPISTSATPTPCDTISACRTRFINTILYLDYDRRGFAYPVVPFHVNCYGSSVIAKRGSSAHLTGAADPDAVDPPGPNPGRCRCRRRRRPCARRRPRGGWRSSPHRAGRMHF